MDFKEFEEAMERTASPEYTVNEGRMLTGSALGLTGEAGEFAEMVKKHIFQGHELDRARAAKEIGDVLWYCALGAKALGYTLQEVAEDNVAKLRFRYPEKFRVEQSVNRVDG